MVIVEIEEWEAVYRIKKWDRRENPAFLVLYIELGDRACLQGVSFICKNGDLRAESRF